MSELIDLSVRVMDDEPTLPKDIRALELLQMVYRGEMKATPQQMRAAIESLPYENPKLSAVGIGYMTNNTFGERLDRAIAASEKAKVVKMIEATVIEPESE